MIKNKNFYSNKIVYKPWGHEYVIYNERSKIAITLVHIKYKHKTSLHCHPKKKTGFIILSGKALVQIGIYKENSKIFFPLSRLVFRSGLFHSIKSISKEGVYALEFETPYKKEDLIRLRDNYGRQYKNYEGKNFTKKISNLNLIKFRKPKINKRFMYNFNDIEVFLETINNLKNLKLKNDNSSSAILNGSILDKKGQKVITCGEVVKTKTLKIFSKRYKINKPITILNVSKTKRKNFTNNVFI